MFSEYIRNRFASRAARLPQVDSVRSHRHQLRLQMLAADLEFKFGARLRLQLRSLRSLDDYRVCLVLSGFV